VKEGLTVVAKRKEDQGGAGGEGRGWKGTGKGGE